MVDAEGKEKASGDMSARIRVDQRMVDSRRRRYTIQGGINLHSLAKKQYMNCSTKITENNSMKIVSSIKNIVYGLRNALYDIK